MPSSEVLTALESLHRDLDRLQPAIKHVETAQQVTELVKKVPKLHIELLEAVKADELRYKDELKTLFFKELTGFTNENKKLQEGTAAIQQVVKREQEALAQVKESVQSFHKRVETIQFPERLDKLDANVAGNMAAAQALQSRLDSLERNVADRIRDVSDYQKETRQITQTNLEQLKISLKTSIEAATKKQQVFTYVTWILVVTAAVVICLIK